MDIEEILTPEQVTELLRHQLLIYKLFVIEKHIGPIQPDQLVFGSFNESYLGPLMARADKVVGEWAKENIK